MGDKILKWVEAILGGAITFVVLYFLFNFILRGYFDRQDFFGIGGAGLIFIPILIAGFSFCMIFVYYHLLTKN